MRIAIIGGGATGALAALHVARRVGGRADTVLIEPREAIGRGIAYSTPDPRHLLNVLVSNVSAFADSPNHLHEWLTRRGHPDSPGCRTPFCFIPRATYGEYISDLMSGVLASGAVRHVRDACVDLSEAADAVTLHLSSGRTIEVDRVILATGHDAKPSFEGIPAEQPWTEGSLDGLSRDAPILVIGSGLTMVDMTVSLDRRGHQGPITAVSRRGLLSLAHRPVMQSHLVEQEIPFGAELSRLLAWMRGLTTRLTAQGADWRSAIDALRPHTQRLWRSMTLEQKQRFYRHARAYWDIHRHRMAPEVERHILALRSSGRLKLIAGRVLGAELRDDGVHVSFLRRGSGGSELHRFARLIDCTGLPDNPKMSVNPLIRAWFARGYGRRDPLGIGLDVAENYALIDAEGRPSRRVQVIGPLARAAFWECIAIPDIRLQCEGIADAFADELAESV
jgi:uncharacterized NAD(P)/FAD-binding protein YdhS